MIDIIAAICLEQMKKLPEHLEFRRHVQSRYNAELNPMIERPPHSETVQYYGPLKQDREYPVCESEWVKLLTLPCHNRMIEEDIDYVIYWVNKYFEDNI